ncbi:hypothetical protein [Rubrivirga sp.]|uniref:hypothetical protein n=1 Tax=Rubrivirga sp. TaxID=1885344 RepID=UPI003C741ACB
MSTTARTSVLRGLEPEPFHFSAVEDVPPLSREPFAPLFERGVLEDEFVPLFQTDSALESTSSPASLATPPPTPLTYHDGLEAGRSEVALEISNLEAEVERLTGKVAQAEDADRQHQEIVTGAVERLSALWADAVRALEADLAALAIDVAEGVLDAPLTDAQRAASSSVLAQAVDTLSSGPAIDISTHPVDHLHLRESGLTDALSAAHTDLHWDTNAALNEGDWRVSTSEGAVHRVRAEMFESLRDRLGLTTNSS